MAGAAPEPEPTTTSAVSQADETAADADLADLLESTITSADVAEFQAVQSQLANLTSQMDAIFASTPPPSEEELIQAEEARLQTLIEEGLALTSNLAAEKEQLQTQLANIDPETDPDAYQALYAVLEEKDERAASGPLLLGGKPLCWRAAFPHSRRIITR